jgi:phosphate transport system permease protein
MSAVTVPRTDAPVLVRTKRDWAGLVFRLAALGSLLLALLVLAVLAGTVVVDSLPVWSERGVGFLRSDLSPRVEETGVWLAVRGTIIISLFVMLVAFPLGIACAVWLEEYAGDRRWARLVALNIRNLAGVPSIVYGLLGLAVFVKALGGTTGGRTVIAAGLTLSALVLPIIVITAAEAIRAVPASFRDGAYALGATRWETVRHHVLPSAGPGILTGTVLSLSRAAGEAAPLVLVGAVSLFYSTGDQGAIEQLFGAFTALPMLIFGWARQPGEDWAANTAAASLVLLMLVLALNSVAIWLRNRFESKR